jgi:nitrogenase molybdenum-iron protein alpha/beta subunit
VSVNKLDRERRMRAQLVRRSNQQAQELLSMKRITPYLEAMTPAGLGEVALILAQLTIHLQGTLDSYGMPEHLHRQYSKKVGKMIEKSRAILTAKLGAEGIVSTYKIKTRKLLPPLKPIDKLAALGISYKR